MSIPTPPMFAAAPTTITANTAATTRAATDPAQSGSPLEYLIISAVALLAIFLAVRIRVLARRSIDGPPRLDDDESPGLLLLGFGGGFIIWILAQVLFLAPTAPTVLAPAPSTTPAAATAPTTVPAELHLSPARMAVVAILPAAIAAAFVIALNLSLRRNGLHHLGLARSQLRPGLIAGLIGSAIMIPLVFLVMILTQLLWQAIHYEHPKEHDLLRLMTESPSPAITTLLILSAVLVAPFWEELLFRGQLQTLLTYALARLHRRPTPRGFDVISPETAMALDYAAIGTPNVVPVAPAPWMRWVAVLFTSLAFSIVHPTWTIPPIFFLSLCLGYTYERTGNLWATMFMHAAFNTTSTLIYLLQPH